jgi:putative transposase
VTIHDDHIPVIDERADSDDAQRGGPRELRDELIDELLAGARTPVEITGEGGLLQTLTKRLIERAMDAELTDHLGYERGHAPPGGTGNSRNGSTPKTLHTDHGSVAIHTPRDRVVPASTE